MRSSRRRRPEGDPPRDEGWDGSVLLLVLLPALLGGSVLASALAAVDARVVLGVWTFLGLSAFMIWRLADLAGLAWGARARRARGEPAPDATAPDATAPDATAPDGTAPDGASGGRLRPRPGASCPLCRQLLDPTEIEPNASCAGCGTAYHVACLFELGGCSTLGCAAGASARQRA